ncbi:MAG: protein-glutamate O-methyltransferase CheR [Planctomycetales bacterium]
MTIDAFAFEYVRKLVREHSGIVLEDGKEYLVESRLAPLVRQDSFDTLGDLIFRLMKTPLGPLHHRVIEAMATNETSFFRDFHPFEMLRKSVLPELVEKRKEQRRLAIWCAACSSGQEPYSIAMLLRESFPHLAGWSLRVIATDMAAETLDRAREGRYGQFEISRGLPAKLLVKYFTQREQEWILADEIRRMVEFTQVNLAGGWIPLPPLDLVLLRNVLIYFDQETKQSILTKVARVMQPDGRLLLGSTESVLQMNNAFEHVKRDQSSYYRLKAEADCQDSATA